VKKTALVFLRDLDTEFKTKLKALQNEDAKEALKTRAEEMKKEIEGITPGMVLDEATFHRSQSSTVHSLKHVLVLRLYYDLFKNVNLDELLKQLEKSVRQLVLWSEPSSTSVYR
jgi:hypothetical protein